LRAVGQGAAAAGGAAAGATAGLPAARPGGGTERRAGRAARRSRQAAPGSAGARGAGAGGQGRRGGAAAAGADPVVGSLCSLRRGPLTRRRSHLTPFTFRAPSVRNVNGVKKIQKNLRGSRPPLSH